MAVKIERLDNVVATTFVTPTSRYATSAVLAYGEDSILTFETYKRSTTAITAQDRFLVVPPGEEYRPDLTSFRAYNTVDFWWKILQTNNISDIFDYKAGLNIRIPTPLNL